MTPMFLNEAIAQTFVFYQDGSLYRGLALQHRLFKLVRYFHAGNRDLAFGTGWELSDQRWEVIISASPQGYGVWVDVRANVACVGVDLFGDDMPQPRSQAALPDWNSDTAFV
ncbi:MAG: hypothetical protein VKK04_16460 [Synechococcales bacterium]|nr:hypothetical protein [Synechococcales bacterium]